MCKTPIKIFNRSKYVDLKDFDVIQEVPCGHCVECLINKRSEYALRAHYEAESCRKDGGFVYFETLTYNDKNLPTLFGLPCFRPHDIQYFIKRLRYNLKRYCNISKDAFRFFCASEYGSKHKRPHYHVLFFVHVPASSLDFLKFHALIHRCWKFGNTDLRNAVDPTLGICQTDKAILYVTKYITKEDDYVEEILSRAKSHLGTDYCDEEQRKIILQRFRPFHRQSVHFGIYLEKCPEQLDKLSKGFATMPIGKEVDKKINLPLYYRRHLFYKLVLNADGSQSWVLNSHGQFLADSMELQSFNKQVDTCTNYIENAQSYVNTLLLDEKDTIESKREISSLSHQVDSFLGDGASSCVHSRLIALLDGRDVATFVKYKRYFKDRFVSDCSSIDSVIDSRIYGDPLDSNPLWSDDHDEKMSSRLLYYDKRVDENFDYRFRDFDRLDAFLSFLKTRLNIRDIASEIETRELKRSHSDKNRSLSALKFV